LLFGFSDYNILPHFAAIPKEPDLSGRGSKPKLNQEEQQAALKILDEHPQSSRQALGQIEQPLASAVTLRRQGNRIRKAKCDQKAACGFRSKIG
jgi:hypothetical protein